MALQPIVLNAYYLNLGNRNAQIIQMQINATRKLWFW